MIDVEVGLSEDLPRQKSQEQAMSVHEFLRNSCALYKVHSVLPRMVNASFCCAANPVKARA
jgi:hypothetical protein